MKRMAAILMVTMSAAIAANAQKVTVCRGGMITRHVMYAQATAREMFLKVGLQIEWADEKKNCPEGALRVTFATDAPASVAPGVLAYALPFEGTHIRVYLDRVHDAVSASLTQRLLAHVLVHEITHMLQGVARHSDSGVMKAVWTQRDYQQMGTGTLPFAQEDIDLLQRGLVARGAAAPVLIAADR